MACDRSAITWLTASASANGPGMRKTRAPQLVVRALGPGSAACPKECRHRVAKRAYAERDAVGFQVRV
jgi:hypothetical protein